VIVSSLWWLLSLGVVLGFFSNAFLIPIAILMGGSVVGVASQKEKYKKIIILVGMPIAYFLVTNLTKVTVLIELVAMTVIALILFVDKGPANPDLEKKLKQCC